MFYIKHGLHILLLISRDQVGSLVYTQEEIMVGSSKYGHERKREIQIHKREIQVHQRQQRAQRRAQLRDEVERQPQQRERTDQQRPRVGEAEKRECSAQRSRPRKRGGAKSCGYLFDKIRKVTAKSSPLEDELIDRQQLFSKMEKYNERFRAENSFEPEHDSNFLQVKDMPREDVTEAIKKYDQKGLTSITRGLPVPSRSPSNIRWDAKHKRWVVKRRKVFIRNPNCQKYLATLAVLVYILELCKDNITMEIRGIFYRSRDLFMSVESVSAIIDDICCMIGCTRSSLHVTACEKGVVIGNISFKEGEIAYNGNDSGKKGISIPSMTHSVSIIKDTDALCMLIVEKHTVFSRLAEDEFHKNYRCIMITARGMPDVASKNFVNKARNKLQLPVYSLNDFNPYGMKITSVFRFGSKNMAYDSKNLTTPNIKLLGILHKHLEKYPLPANVRLKMNDHDKNIAKRLLEKDYLGELDDELQFMLNTGTKLELEAFCAFGFRYLSKVFLHLEIQSLCDEEQDVDEQDVEKLCEGLISKCTM